MTGAKREQAFESLNDLLFSLVVSFWGIDYFHLLFYYRCKYSQFCDILDVFALFFEEFNLEFVFLASKAGKSCK